MASKELTAAVRIPVEAQANLVSDLGLGCGTIRPCVSCLTLGQRSGAEGLIGGPPGPGAPSDGIGWSRRLTETRRLPRKDDGGNLAGNPVATTRRCGTALVGTRAGPEQPRWSSPGPVGGFQTDS